MMPAVQNQLVFSVIYVLFQMVIHMYNYNSKQAASAYIFCTLVVTITIIISAAFMHIGIGLVP